MALKRGKDTNYTYQGFALVDETHFPHGGCFNNRKSCARLRIWSFTCPREGASGLRPSVNNKLSPVAISNAIQTRAMSGYHGEANPVITAGL